MKKVLAILLVFMSLFFIFSCVGEPKEPELIIDAEKSKICMITADLDLTDLVGEYTIYYGAIGGKVYEGEDPIMVVNGGEIIHLDNLYLPSACFSLIVVNDNGDKYVVSIDMKYCTLPEEEA